MLKKSLPVAQIPVAVALVALLCGGIFLLERSEAQARDTIRKHHLADIEQALLLAQRRHGTYPPYDQPFWCGTLNGSNNQVVREQVEAALRQRHELYANLAKPFPTDPLKEAQGGKIRRTNDYFYWKRSPATFELFALLEADNQGTFDNSTCNGSDPAIYTYGLNSRARIMDHLI